MSKCLIVINMLCGQSDLISEEKLVALYSQQHDVTVKKIRYKEDTWSPEGYDIIVACGGDGTFNRTINNITDPNTILIYYSFGTFNECAKTRKPKKGDYIELTEYAKANKGFIGYVCAAGSFTPLGYITPTVEKKKQGIFSYFKRVMGQYIVYNIPAKIDIDGTTYEDKYTLMMILDSNRCFGFKFNHLYKQDDGLVHILLIKSPGDDSKKNRRKIFGPLFRSFFIGFRKEVENDKLLFKAAKNISIKLDESVTFGVDGDKKSYDELNINVVQAKNKIYIGNFDEVMK